MLTISKHFRIEFRRNANHSCVTCPVPSICFDFLVKMISLNQQVVNLEPPYTTACRKQPLETGHPYSLKGCIRVCEEMYVRKQCGCNSPIGFMDGMEF